jgi:hypothetical protein
MGYQYCQKSCFASVNCNYNSYISNWRMPGISTVITHHIPCDQHPWHRTGAGMSNIQVIRRYLNFAVSFQRVYGRQLF